NIRLSTEAVLLSAPLGTVSAEGLKAVLLERRCGVALADGIASIVGKKALLAVALGLYVAVAALGGQEALARDRLARPLARPGLALAAGAAVAIVLLRGGRIAGRLHGALAALPFLRRWIAGLRGDAEAVDAGIRRSLGDGPRVVRAALAF